jgi:tryptophan synthase beta chain
MADPIIKDNIDLSDNQRGRGMFSPSEHGYYGKFGGAYIPEMLHRNVEELRTKYLDIIYETGFQTEYQQLLHDYVGRPTPLYFAQRLSRHYGASIFLKREDLCHTGAHKVNNTVGQILLAQRLGKVRIIAETGAGQHGVATASISALFSRSTKGMKLFKNPSTVSGVFV